MLLTPSTTSAPHLRADSRGTEAQQRRELMAYLDRYLRHCLRTGVHGALVFDIDDTLIFARSSSLIPDVAAIYKKYSRHFPTYVVTARSNKWEAETAEQLHRHGLDGYRKLLLLPDADRADPGVFKWRSRCDIRRKHGRVLAAVGDQAWDATPWPIPDALADLDAPSRRHGSLIHTAPIMEVGCLLPAREM